MVGFGLFFFCCCCGLVVLFVGCFFLFQSTSTTTLKLHLLFVLQPRWHGLITCKCCQKVEVARSKCRKQLDFAGGTGLMKHCVGIVSSKVIVYLDLFVNPPY